MSISSVFLVSCELVVVLPVPCPYWDIVVEWVLVGAHSWSKQWGRGGVRKALETGALTADHCKVLSAGQTGFNRSPRRRPHGSARSHPHSMMWKSDRGRLSDVRSHRRAPQCRLFSTPPHSSERGDTRLIRHQRAYLVWDAAMSRGTCPRVNSCGSFWILSAVVLAASVTGADAYSCHEVRTAFQLRQVGPLHRVPETPGTGEPSSTPLREHFTLIVFIIRTAEKTNNNCN